MMESPTLLILAAGMGTRYAGVKWDDPVGPGGEPIMEYSLFDARRAGFGRIVFVIRKEQEQAFRDVAKRHFAKHLVLEFVLQDIHRIPAGFAVPPGRDRPWGTTHAVLGASGTIREPFAVINVDDFYGAQSFHSLATHLRSACADQAMIGFVLRNTLSEFGCVARAICDVNPAGYLEKIVEMKDIEKEGGHARNTDSSGREIRLTGDETASMNIWGFTPAIFAPLREHFLRFLKQHHADPHAECVLANTVNSMVQEGQIRVKVIPSRDAWFGLTYREDEPRAIENIHRLVADGHYPRRLWA